MLQFVRVMAKGADCAENGPFFPTTPRNVIQNGIAIARDIVVMPDWVLIGAMLGSFALLMIILVIGLVSLVFFLFCPREWLLCPDIFCHVQELLGRRNKILGI